MKNPARSATVAATQSANIPCMPIYTRTGDTGLTSLFGGKRVQKSNVRVDTYGSVDELNSWIGLIISQIKDKTTRRLLLDIQSDLLSIGSNLAGSNIDINELDARVDEMEKQIDWYESTLPKLNNFILPGGNPISATIHITRNITRRVERQVVALDNKSTIKIDPKIIKFLNRLSDLFFDMARYINNSVGTQETVWSGIKRQRINKKK